jgi:hypothetical protein
MRRLLTCVCLAHCLASLNPLCAQNIVNITGVLHKIDVKAGAITIRPGKLGAEKERTFSLFSPDIPVVTDQGRARLTDLAVGNIVHLHLNDQEDVDAIRVELPLVGAALTAVDLPTQTIRVLADDLSKKAFTVTATTKITHLGKQLSLAELKVYQWLEITTSLDGKNALAIAAFAPGTRNGRVSSGLLHGSIVLLDVKTGTLLFHNTKGRERLLSFAVPKDVSTWLLFDDRPVDMLVGPQVIAATPASVYLAPDHTEVRRILIQAPLLRCRVSAVDVEKRRLIANDNGATTTWDLPADIKVLFGRRRGKVEDLRRDMPVDLVLSLDRTKLIAVVLASPQ